VRGQAYVNCGFNQRKERIMRGWQQLIEDENGASAVEYAILASGIAAVIVAVITLLGQTVNGFYTSFSLP